MRQLQRVDRARRLFCPEGKDRYGCALNHLSKALAGIEGLDGIRA